MIQEQSPIPLVPQVLVTETNKFIDYCKNGNIEEAKVLWNEKQTEIDLHYDKNSAFEWCCKKGHLNIAQWLWEGLGHVVA